MAGGVTRHTRDERKALSDNQPLEEGAEATAGGERSSPVDQWTKAEFLVCLTKAHVAAAKVTRGTYRGFLRELAFLVERF